MRLGESQGRQENGGGEQDTFAGVRVHAERSKAYAPALSGANKILRVVKVAKNLAATTKMARGASLFPLQAPVAPHFPVGGFEIEGEARGIEEGRASHSIPKRGPEVDEPVVVISEVRGAG